MVLTTFAAQMKMVNRNKNFLRLFQFFNLFLDPYDQHIFGGYDGEELKVFFNFYTNRKFLNFYSMDIKQEATINSNNHLSEFADKMTKKMGRHLL